MTHGVLEALHLEGGSDMTWQHFPPNGIHGLLGTVETGYNFHLHFRVHFISVFVCEFEIETETPTWKDLGRVWCREKRLGFLFSNVFSFNPKNHWTLQHRGLILKFCFFSRGVLLDLQSPTVLRSHAS